MYSYEKYRDYQLHYQKTSPRAKEARKRYYQENKGKFKEASAKYRNSESGQISRLLGTLKSKATRDQVPFTLTPDFFSPLPDLCPILQIPLSLRDGGWSPQMPTVFLKDPSLGYTPENSIIVSKRGLEVLGPGTPEERKKSLAFCTIYIPQ